MLGKLLLLLWFTTHQQRINDSEQQEEFVPSLYGPQTLEEEAVTRKALYGEHFGGDMRFPDSWNETDGGLKDTKYRWPGYPGGARVPYVIDSSASRYTNVIKQGIAHINQKTCIKIVPRTDETDYIVFVYKYGCWSFIGRKGGPQELSLGDGCGYVGLVAHEILHALGISHMHQRSDRDKYITVYKENVIYSQLHNFNLIQPQYEIICGPYDYDSIMHYGSYAFSRNNKQTMVAKNGHKLVEPYEKPGLDELDIRCIKKLYKC